MESLYGVAPRVLAFLVVAAGLAGWVDAVSGGGGLVQLPALLVGLPGAPPATVLGTNKLSSIIGTSAAAITYRRAAVTDIGDGGPDGPRRVRRLRVRGGRRHPPARHVLPSARARAARRRGRLDPPAPALGEDQDLRWHGTDAHARHRVAAVAMGATIGLYDGVFGPGTGTFLVFGLVALLGYSFLNASAIAKVVNVSTNLAALIVFAASGHILWALGLTMGVANLAGGVIGARTAVRKGSGFVRVVFLVVVAALLAKLGLRPGPTR